MKRQKQKILFLGLIFIFALSGFFSVIFGESVFVLSKDKLFRLAGVYTEAIPSVTIHQDGYTNQTPGTYGIIKSAKWTSSKTAEVTFDVQSIMKSEDNHKDIILVMDISGSMSGEKLEKAKQDSIELVETILSDSNNRISFITFDNTSTIVSPFTNNKKTLINQIQNIYDRGTTNYNSGLINAKEVLEGYQKQNNKDLVLLFLTDGYPNVDIHNEIATYQILKEKYPYMTIQGIQYEMGTKIHEDIKNISDNQFIANMTTLENVLFEASVAPYIYEEFIITDYIHDDYFTVGSVDDIKVPYGTVQLVPEGNGQKVIWDLSGLYRSGSNVQMKINLTLKQQYVGGEGFYPTNKKETITSQLPEEEIKTKNSDLTPVLSSHYKVIYDSNVPTGCTNQDLPTEKHMVYEVVEKKTTKLTCQGYQFKGWELDLNDSLDIQKVNNDVFIMPGHDVTIRGQWTKHNIEKSMDGMIHVVRKVTNLYTDGTLIINDEDIDTNIIKHGSIVKEYEGFSENQPYKFTEFSYSTSLWYGERNQIKRVEIGEEIQPTSTAYWFYELHNMEEGDFTNLDTSKVTNMRSMFYNAGYSSTKFNLVGLNLWDVSKVENMDSMFISAGQKATTFDIGDLSSWNVSSVTNMSTMFRFAGQKATILDIGDLSSWNVSKVTNMSLMFQNTGTNATTFDIGDLSSWDTSNVMDMSYMFYGTGTNATTWTIGDLSSWNVSNVTNMSSMFYNAGQKATTFDIGDLSSWDTSKVTNMSGMFSNAGYSATTWNIGDLSSWNTSKVASMNSMFKEAGYTATTWDIGDLSSWNTSQVTNMSYMFYNAGYTATAWTIRDLSSWDTSQVTNMSYMFSGAGYTSATFNLELSSWDVSKVTNMNFMFYNAGYSATTWSIGDLSGWDTSNVTEMISMFDHAGYNTTTWNIGNLKVYATNIRKMFYSCRNAKVTLTMHSNPTFYEQMFFFAATTPGSGITVNYSSATTNIDAIIATKSSDANVVKGVQID